MTPEDFERLQTLMASRTGFRLTRDRMKLAEHRLGPVARREGFETVGALLASLWAKPVASLGWAVIEALLNPETWFRRDRASFETLERELLPALGTARGGAPLEPGVADRRDRPLPGAAHYCTSARCSADRSFSSRIWRHFASSAKSIMTMFGK